MNRLIKFRSWNVEEKIMHDIAMPSWNGSHEVWKNNIPQSEIQYLTNDPAEEGILMQFTGLKDKNGKEIYEGDIVKWVINGNERIAPVYYDGLQACFWMGKDKNTNMLVLNDWMRGEHEVIGNIYQNPELLK